MGFPTYSGNPKKFFKFQNIMNTKVQRNYQWLLYIVTHIIDIQYVIYCHIYNIIDYLILSTLSTQAAK